MKPELISLEEFNQKRIKYHKQRGKYNQSLPNGIACPVCGRELWDINPNEQFQGVFPKIKVYCSNCRFEGMRHV